VKRDGALAQALLFGGDAVMLGSAFAGTVETPGEIVMKPVLMPDSQKVARVPFKVFRGMASVGAVRDRLDLEDVPPPELEALGAEGLEVSVPARGSVRAIIHDMLKHLCSAISYGGVSTLQEFRARFWADPTRYLIRLSQASRTESFDR
jgi:IMP dehydrogenase